MNYYDYQLCGTLFSMFRKQIDDVTRRELPRLHISTTHNLIFNQNYNKIMFFMIIYPLLINLKALKYQKSIRVSENNTTPIREIYLILPH